VLDAFDDTKGRAVIERGGFLLVTVRLLAIRAVNYFNKSGH
jgi:hypothetical protein